MRNTRFLSKNKSICKMALLPIVFWSSTSLASWTLSGEESSLHYVSIKADQVGELNTFKHLEGKISDAGEFVFSIHLASVETYIPIRNERTNEFLFETAKFPLATGKGKVDASVLANLTIGEVKSIKVPVQIDLHGKSATKEVVFQVTKLSAEKLWTVTPAPFLINAAEFDLNAGVDKLKELAGLPNIARAVPVTASLVFTLDKAAKK